MAFDFSKGEPVGKSGFSFDSGNPLDGFQSIDQKSRNAQILDSSRETLGSKITETAGDVVSGAAKEVAKTGINTLRLGERVGNLLTAPLRAMGFGKESKVVQETTKDILPKLEPEGGAQKVGSAIAEIAEYALPFAKVAKLEKGAGLLSRVGIEGATGLTSGAAKEGSIDKNVIDNAIVSAVFPVVGSITKKVASFLPEGKDVAGRVVNSLIKPLAKDFSYGKDPGKAVAEAGITGKTLEEIATNISKARNSTGRQIAEKIASSPVKNINAGDALLYLDEAISSAMEAPRTNASMIKRLYDLKSDILGETVSESGDLIASRQLENLSPQDLFSLKSLVGDLTKFTGNASDDKTVNMALKRVYGSLKEKLNDAVPGLAPLNEKYADLTSAEVATKYRDVIAQRQNLVSLPQNIVGLGSALATAIVSGGAAVPTILAGVGAATLEKALSSPFFKTNFATWLAKSTPEEKKALFNAIPALKSAVLNVFDYSFDE